MHKKIKVKWIDELSGTKYHQGFGRLRNHRNEYCPFGVLCDIIDPDGWKQASTGNYAHRGIFASPCESVLHACGMKREDTLALLAKNDRDKMSFVDISKFILEIF